MTDTFKYFAFISYNSLDNHWGKRLHNRLEHFRMPSTLCSQHGWKRTPMRPIFFAPTDIQPGPLSDELKNRLNNSRHLIVVCSPNSAQSEWVGKEIEYFHSLGRINNIHFFIVKGTPNSNDPTEECFNPIIKKLGLLEILASNIHEKVYTWPWLNRERAYVQLISKLLGVEFDAIWQRHKRSLIRKALVWTIGCLAVITALICVWHVNQPFDVTLRINESSVHNSNLPPLENAIIKLNLDNEIKSGILTSLDSCLVFSNIPHRFLNRNMQFKVSCPDFLDLDTTLPLTQSVTLNLRRNDSTYGAVSFRIYNPDSEKHLSNIKIILADQEALTDSIGRVSFQIPLEKQQKYYIITSSIPLERDTVFMPCGKSVRVMTK